MRPARLSVIVLTSSSTSIVVAYATHYKDRLVRLDLMIMTTEEAEAALQAWATVQRDELVQAAYQAGVSKNRIHAITGIARTTIDRILEAPVGTPQQQITAYLEKFTEQWPRDHGFAWYGQPTMASAYTAGHIADALLADAEFRALRLGTWLNTPSGELLAAAVTALTPAPFNQDLELLIEALQLAAQRQQAEARQKIAAGLLGGAVLAIALGSSRS